MRRADLTDDAFQAAMADWEVPRPSASSLKPVVHLFRAPWLDAFTRTPPWTPYAVGLPIALFALGLGWEARAGSPWEQVGALCFGAAVWSLVEYLLHRFIFHAQVRSETARIAVFLAHGHHHASPLDRTRIAAPPVQLASALLLLFGLCDLVFDGSLLWTAFAGAVLAYVGYEALHYLIHHGASVHGGRLFRALRRHHLAHHHRDARSRWGISSPLWDVLLRTRGE